MLISNCHFLSFYNKLLPVKKIQIPLGLFVIFIVYSLWELLVHYSMVKKLKYLDRHWTNVCGSKIWAAELAGLMK